MVKNQRDTAEKFEKSEESEVVSEINKYLLDLSEETLCRFISLVVKYTKIKKACKNIKNAYIILCACFFIYEQNPRKEDLTKSKSLCKETLSELIKLHSISKTLTQKCLHFKLTQSILNMTTTILRPLQSELQSNIKLLICTQILKIFIYLNFEIIMQAFMRLLNGENTSSIFSLFTSSVSPFLPPKNKHEFTLVLDLDETLGHFEGKKFIARPFVDNFLMILSKRFELVLFTSALEIYANYAMTVVDKQNLVVLRLYRQNLQRSEGRFVKDLTLLGRDLGKLIIVDNEPKNFILQPRNGIPIKTWRGEEDDTELMKLAQLLEKYVDESKTSQVIVEEILCEGILGK